MQEELINDDAESNDANEEDILPVQKKKSAAKVKATTHTKKPKAKAKGAKKTVT